MPKTWFITGSSRGLGRSLAAAALAAGHRVAATARRPGQLDDLVVVLLKAETLDEADAYAAAGLTRGSASENERPVVAALPAAPGPIPGLPDDG